MKCLIIEDEIPAQQILKNYLKRIPHLDLLGCCNSVVSAQEFLGKTKVDLIFVDINLPDASGLDFIKTIDHPPAVIMTTAYPQHAASSFELDTIVDYLVKPFSLERFLKALKKANAYANQTTDTGITNSFYINVDKTLHKIIVMDILYIESDRNYVTLVLKDKKLCYLESLSSWAERLPNNFLQVHKSYIINLTEISKIAGNLLYLGVHKIPIGRTFKDALIRRLNY